MPFFSGENRGCILIRKSIQILGFGLVAAIMVLGNGEATLAPDYNLPVAITWADVLVHGQVIETSSSWVDGPNGRNIFTRVRLRVERVYRGSVPADVIDFVVMGGTIDGITQTVSHQPIFQAGEEVVVLLASDENVPTNLAVMSRYGKTAIRNGQVRWKGSAIPADAFLEVLEAYIESPSMDLNEHLGLLNNQVESHREAIAKHTEIELAEFTIQVVPREPQPATGGDASGPAVCSTTSHGSMADEHEVDQSGLEAVRLIPFRTDVEPRAVTDVRRKIMPQSQSGFTKAAGPDLAPYKLPAWDNEIVISTVMGTGSTATTIYDDQTIYTDWACGNYGTSDAGHFRYGLYIDGSRIWYVEESSLASGYVSYVEDAAVGPLSAGMHTFKIVCDYYFEVSETNEYNNEFSRAYTVSATAADPDLAPYKRNSWDNKIVLSTVTGTGTTASTIYDDQTIYTDWGCWNYGSGDAGHFRYGLYVDGTRVLYVDQDSLAAGFGSYVEDAPVGPLSAGTHSVKIVCDYFYEVSESNESNNEYSRAITVHPSVEPPDLRPYQAPIWDDAIVLSTGTGTGTTAGTIYDDQTIYTDWGCGNFGSGDAGQFRYGLYVDGIRIWYVEESSLAAGYASYAEDAAVGPLSAGSHTFKVVCDYNSDVGESNEGNNEYSRTFPITSPEPDSEISSFTPEKASAGTGTNVTISGSGFGSVQGNGAVEFWYGRGSGGDPDRIEAPVSSWTDSSIVCEVPVDRLNDYSASASTGPLRVVEDSGAPSNEVTFVVSFSYMGRKWDNSSGPPEVPFRVNENTVDCSGEGAAVVAGANTWNDAGAAFAFEYAGSHTNNDVGFNSYNDIMWSDILPAGVLAQAASWAFDGEILEADIAYNDDYGWSSDSMPAPAEYDIQSVMIHELGHWLSLRDLYGDLGGGASDVGKVMYGRRGAGEVKRDFHADDVEGILWIYGTAGDGEMIFSDGFETGDCSEWSAEVP